MIKKWLKKFLGLDDMEERQRMLEESYNYLLFQSSRKLRRKWLRMLTRPESKYYIRKVVKENDEKSLHGLN
jgi:hypothetical protein